jgi:hypothetical protein
MTLKKNKLRDKWIKNPCSKCGAVAEQPCQAIGQYRLKRNRPNLSNVHKERKFYPVGNFCSERYFEDYIMMTEQQMKEHWLSFLKERKAWHESWASKLPISFRACRVVFKSGARNPEEVKEKIQNQEIGLKFTRNYGKKTHQELQDYFLNA